MTPGKRMVVNIDNITLVETLLQYFFIVGLSPLFAGIFGKVKSMVESKKGPSIFQPYYDLAKLLKKETLRPKGSGIVFIYAPYVIFGIYSLISLIIPALIPDPIYFTASTDFLGGAIMLLLAAFIKIAAAFGSNSNYSALGVSRMLSFNFLAEGTLITVFFAVSLITSTNNPYTTNHFLAANPLQNISVVHIFSTLAFFMLFLYETGKVPVESEGLMEFGMIDAATNYEYSGKLLAISKWNGYIKQFLLGSILLNVFLVPWWLNPTFPWVFLNIPVMFAKWLLLIGIVLVVETTLAKLRLFRVLDYLATAFAFSILFLIFTEVML